MIESGHNTENWGENYLQRTETIESRQNTEGCGQKILIVNKKL